MPVVIGEVEVVPTAPQRGTSPNAEVASSHDEGGLTDAIALQRAMQVLQEQALRNWSH